MGDNALVCHYDSQLKQHLYSICLEYHRLTLLAASMLPLVFLFSWPSSVSLMSFLSSWTATSDQTQWYTTAQVVHRLLIMDACYLVVLDLLELEHQVQRLLMLGSVVVGCTWQHLSWHNRRTFRRVSNESHQRCQPQDHTSCKSLLTISDKSGDAASPWYVGRLRQTLRMQTHASFRRPRFELPELTS